MKELNKAEDEEEKAVGFWLAGGEYYRESSRYPLAGLARNFGVNYDDDFSVGWLVLNCSTDHC